jgi:predicted O-methyltransferase YrrM
VGASSIEKRLSITQAAHRLAASTAAEQPETPYNEISMGDPLWRRIRMRMPANMSVIEVRDILRQWLVGARLREVARLSVSHIARRYPRHPYRGRGRMLRALGPDLASMTTWSAVDTELQGEMAEVFNRTPRVHKFAHYLPIYESVVDRTRPIRMLEIGDFYGDSLQMWQEYLHPDSLIVGIDINSKLLKIADSVGIHVRFGGEQGVSFLKEVAAEFGPFDVILDDGSHTSSHMVDSFRSLFANVLSDSGVYMVEDVDCDYWKSYRDSRVSFIDFVRALIDAMHGHYQVTTSETNFRVGHPDRIREVSVPAITPILGGIEVYDSIVVVRRATRDLARSIYRS